MLSAVTPMPSAALSAAWYGVPLIEQARAEVKAFRPGLPPGGTGSATPPAGALTPQQVESAYGATGITFTGSISGTGLGQTIALVDAYDYPTALTDLMAFDAQYNLPDPPSFEVLNQNGQTTPLPVTDPAGAGSPNGTWEGEAALDIEWSHAMAPQASLVLVEANDPTSLFTAAASAARLSGVSVVSMSFSNDETPNEQTTDATFLTPVGHQGVTFVAAAGDNGAYNPNFPSSLDPQYPDASPNVVSVGGTSLTVNPNGTYGSESVWGSGSNSGFNGGGGGGISAIEPQPEFQKFLVTQSTTNRTYPDVAMLADPGTGVAVYDSYDNGAMTPWDGSRDGGTSLAAPLFSGVLAIANQGRTINRMGTLDGSKQTLPLLYSLPSADFHDIVTGSNGYSATPGYDLASGRGSAVVNNMVASLSTPYIGYHVFNDANFNGVQDAGEAGIAGVTVQLKSVGTDKIIGTADDVLIQTTTTDSAGLYGFNNIAPGTYYVHFVSPSGYQISPTGTSTLTSTDSVPDRNGNTPAITVTASTDNFLENTGMFASGVSINDVTVTRPHSGVTPLVFTVTLTPGNASGATIGYTTDDGTATVANNDYQPTSGSLYFPPGITTETITVEAVGNNTIESNVSFLVNLTLPPGYNGIKTTGTGTILNSNFPAASISSPAAQTRSGTANLTYAFSVTLSQSAPFAVSVPYTTTDISAVGGVDYMAVTGTLIFPAGTTGPQTIDVTVLPGTSRQLTKTFGVTLLPSSTVTVGTPSEGTGTILSNAPPAISAVSGSITESLNGLTYLPFNIQITPSLTSPITVNYTTTNGTAIAGVDYQAESGTLTFPTGRIQETVFVPVYQQFIAAQTKTLGLTISNPTNGLLIATASATGTIQYQSLVALPFSSTQRAVYTDSLNQRVVVSLRGMGNGNVIFLGSASNSTNAYQIVTNGTNTATNLTISVAGGRQTSLTDLVVNGSIGSISARTTNILSSVSGTGGMTALSLGYIQGSTITIGGLGGGQTVGLAFNRVLNSAITSAIPIRFLTAGAYLDTTGSPTYITAPTVGTVKIKGNFGGTIKTTSIVSLNVSGVIDGGGILASKSIGSVTASGILNSRFFAGVDGVLASLPTSSTDFANKRSTIGSIRVNGGVFSNSQIASWSIANVSVSQVGTTIGAASFGITANHVGKIRASGVGFSRKVLQLSNPTEMTKVDNFIVDPV